MRRKKHCVECNYTYVRCVMKKYPIAIPQPCETKASHDTGLSEGQVILEWAS